MRGVDARDDVGVARDVERERARDERRERDVSRGRSRERARSDDGVDATDSVGEPSALLLLRTPPCTLRRSESSAAVERARLPNLTTRRGGDA